MRYPDQRGNAPYELTAKNGPHERLASASPLKATVILRKLDSAEPPIGKSNRVMLHGELVIQRERARGLAVRYRRVGGKYEQRRRLM